MKCDKLSPCVIYVITNLTNGKRYVGITAKPISVRLSGHFSQAKSNNDQGSLHRAMRKYPREAFSIEVIENHPNCFLGLEAEVRLIREFRPEYNSTVGGDGRPGGGESHFSPEGRRRMSDFHKGKRWRLGKHHSDKTKDRLREVGLQSGHIWRKYSHLGPKSLQREIECVDDGLKFESIASAARHYGVAKSALNELCRGQRGRKTVGGLRFRYAVAAEVA